MISLGGAAIYEFVSIAMKLIFLGTFGLGAMVLTIALLIAFIRSLLHGPEREL